MPNITFLLHEKCPCMCLKMSMFVRVFLQEVSRDSRHVTLSLGRLTREATGMYKCEVLADFPSFRTQYNEAFMTVLSE